jgi:hypothetical protein
LTAPPQQQQQQQKIKGAEGKFHIMSVTSELVELMIETLLLLQLMLVENLHRCLLTHTWKRRVIKKT